MASKSLKILFAVLLNWYIILLCIFKKNKFYLQNFQVCINFDGFFKQTFIKLKRVKGFF